MSFRKEKKFRLTLSDFQILKFSLFERGMNELYPERKVQSYYYDTKDLKMFEDSDEGILPRKKIRVRKYNEENFYNQEIKITSEEGRYKITKPLKEPYNKKNYYKSFLDSQYGILIPTLFVSYFRKYYFLDNLRITFDRNISYQNLRTDLGVKMIDPECVMEIKTDISTEDDFIFNIINIPTSRFSKYCRGIIMLNSYN